MTDPETGARTALIELAGKLAAHFAASVQQDDHESAFPEAKYAELRDSGYLTLTIPRENGGMGANLLELTSCQERLARGDAALAMLVGPHLAFLGMLAELPADSNRRFAELYRSVKTDGVLINLAPSTTTPTVTALPCQNGYLLNGSQTFINMNPAVRYLVLAALKTNGGEPAGEIAHFLIEHDRPGLSITATRDTIITRAASNQDIMFCDVTVPEPARIDNSAQPASNNPTRLAWNTLPAAAIYLGIAQAAADFAIEYAKNRKPTSINKPIAELPHIQTRIGQIQLDLLNARQMLFGAAREWIANPDESMSSSARIAAAQYTVTNSAVEIVDLAMRIVGGVSMFRRFPLERYYRQVRAGLVYPPAGDSALTLLAQSRLGAKSSA